MIKSIVRNDGMLNGTILKSAKYATKISDQLSQLKDFVA